MCKAKVGGNSQRAAEYAKTAGKKPPYAVPFADLAAQERVVTRTVDKTPPAASGKWWFEHQVRPRRRACAPQSLRLASYADLSARSLVLRRAKTIGNVSGCT